MSTRWSDLIGQIEYVFSCQQLVLYPSAAADKEESKVPEVDMMEKEDTPHPREGSKGKRGKRTPRKKKKEPIQRRPEEDAPIGNKAFAKTLRALLSLPKDKTPIHDCTLGMGFIQSQMRKSDESDMFENCLPSKELLQTLYLVRFLFLFVLTSANFAVNFSQLNHG